MSFDIAIVGAPQVPAFKPELSVNAIAEKETALANSALIGKVTNQPENDSAVNSMKALKGLSNAIERERKKLTEPFIEAQRAIKRVCDGHSDELERECGRLELLVKDFSLSEQRRIREEQEAQRRELERIERERQAELLRIAREQAAKEAELRRQQEEAERKEREIREANERAVREAANKKQREAAEAVRIESEKRAEAARIERERQQAEAAQRAQEAAKEAMQRAEEATRIESRTIEIARTAGQVNKKVWKIKQINDFQLLKARPDLVRKIEWDMVAIKQLLNDGEKLPGVTAEEDLNINVRGRAQRTIEV